MSAGEQWAGQPWIGYWNGRFVADGEIRLSPGDRGFMLADAAFEATRTYRHVPFHLDWHLDRLFNSLAYLRLDPHVTRAELERLTYEVLERNRARLRPEDDVVITHRITRGESTGIFAGPPDSVPTVIILCRPVAFERYAKYYSEGLELEVPLLVVPSVGGIDPRIKTHNRLLLTLGQVYIGHLRPDVLPLFVDTNGYVTESSGANVLYFKRGRLLTPPDEVALEGISRRALLNLAPEIGIPVERRPVHRDELEQVDEAIVTANSYTLLPVRRLDGRTMAPVPGPLTTALTAAFSHSVGVDIVEQSILHAAQGRIEARASAGGHA